ncbi:MAG: SDR family oxidoreductase [Chloroflexota bacterium]
MRVAVTGAAGRLGRALVEALEAAPFTGPAGPVAWGRDAFDLDAPGGIGERLDRERVEAVVHAAAWTDVDGCALDPAAADRRNGAATGALADACAPRGIDLIVISTNEVFGRERTDGEGWRTDDRPAPANPYAASKLAGERAAEAAYSRSGTGQLAIVRTAWLFGPGKPDFPMKILRAAVAAVQAGEPLRVVGDEWGNPTYTSDLADAIVDVLGSGTVAGRWHVVNGRFASRAHWAMDTIARAGVDVTFEEVPLATWSRPSTPPRWGVLAPTPLPSGEPLRPWRDAMADYAPALLRAHARARQTGAAP